MIKIEVPSEKFLPLIESRRRYKVLYGGRGSGKSQTVASMLLARVSHSKEKVGCFREFQNSIDDSVHSLLRAEIERLDIPGYEILSNEIRHKDGGLFKFRGLARNIESIKSMHDFDIFWIEEAQTVSEESLRLLKPTLRAEGSEMWFTFNPVSRLDPISKEFIIPFENELTENDILF